MNTSSEYNSGCESGWTAYFYQVSSECVTILEDEEDSSLLSDASSGPLKLHAMDSEAHSYYVCEGKKMKNKGSMMMRKPFSECTADTATSQVLRFSQKRSSYCDSQESASFQAESTTKNSKHKGLSKSPGVKSGSSVGRKKK